MAKIEDWHIGLSRLVCGQALHGGYQNINELIQAGAQLIADSVPHAPASTEQKTEIGVDAERQKLVDELVAAAIAWQEIEPACGCGGECHFDRLHNAIKSLKAAGGGK